MAPSSTTEGIAGRVRTQTATTEFQEGLAGAPVWSQQTFPPQAVVPVAYPADDVNVEMSEGPALAEYRTTVFSTES